MQHDDDADDVNRDPSAFGRAMAYFPAHPFISGIVLAFVGFLTLAVLLPSPPHPAPQESPANVVSEAAPKADEHHTDAPVPAPHKDAAAALPEKDVGEMHATPPHTEVAAAPETAPAKETAPASPSVPVLADVAVLITDVGLSRRVAEAIDKQMPVETSLAVSVYASDPQGIAGAFKGSRRDIWVQLAAQSMTPGIDPGPLALAAGMAKKDNIDLLHRQIGSIGATSTGVYLPDDADLTQKSDLWRAIALDAIASNKMVLDGTSAKVSTELFVQGAQNSISAYLKANIIIDGATPPAALKKALDDALPDILKMKEATVVIKRPTVLAVGTIAEWVNGLAGHGIRLVPVSKFTGLKP